MLNFCCCRKLTGELNPNRCELREKPKLEILKNPLEEKEPEKPPIFLPDWLSDEDLKYSTNDTISVTEEHFWIELINEYLKPIDRNADDEVISFIFVIIAIVDCVFFLFKYFTEKN